MSGESFFIAEASNKNRTILSDHIKVTLIKTAPLAYWHKLKNTATPQAQNKRGSILCGETMLDGFIFQYTHRKSACQLLSIRYDRNG